MKRLLGVFAPPPPPVPPPDPPPVSTEPALGDWAWVPLYMGSCICFVAIVLTRQMYKLSPKFRARLRATSFHSTPLDAPLTERAAVALDALACWPATVSEMVADTEAAHGMVFRALMVTGGLAAMQTDFAVLSAPASGHAVLALGVLHQVRRSMFASIVGFCFAPASGEDHGIEPVREAYATSPRSTKLQHGSERLRSLGLTWVADMPLKELDTERRELIGRTMLVGTIHVVLAALMLSVIPLLELLALAWDTLAYLPHVLAGQTWACLWMGLAALRLVHIGCISLCMSHFTAFFVLGIVSRKVAYYKGFWAEFAAARMFAQLVILAAISSWFRPHLRADGSTRVFEELPLTLQALAIVLALAHAASFGRFALRNALLSLRNVEYSDTELAAIFEQWRRQEAVAQSVLDANLMAVQAIQEQLKTTDGASSPRPRGGMRQLASFLRQSRRALRLHDE